MSLLVTSCTMGKQPSRLLDKGPSYLRTRTNTKIFAHRRRSAVELLEASKPQYVKSTGACDQRPLSLHFPDSFNIFSRSAALASSTDSPVSRSKSEYNLSDSAGDSTGDWEDVVDGGTPVGRVVRLQRQQQHSNPVTCRRTLHKPSETTNGKINMSERTAEPRSSTPRRRPPSVEANVAKSGNSGAIPASRDSSQSVSCQNLGEMAADETGGIGVEDKRTESGPTSNEDSERACTPVHRSHSDLNCRHVRDSSVASDKSSRYSRASADLEKFFNQMGLERNVLDPMLRLQEVRGHGDMDMFESVSSLDSPDTRSICSGISRSEKGYSDAESADKSQQSTSVVERNARIIKWLCSVKKAKTNVPGHT